MKLMPFENAWAESALGAMFPGDDNLAGIAVMDVSAYLADVMRQLPSRVALGLRVAIWVTAFAPMFVIGRLGMLRALSPVDRERVIASLMASPWYGLRSLMLMLKAFGALLYASHDSVRERMLPRPSGSTLVPLRPGRRAT